MARKPTVIDFFCGAGGFSEGFREAGFDVLLGLDSIETFTKTFELNKKAKSICADIRKITAKDIKAVTGRRRIDVIIGGPPCQGFSHAGRRDRKDPRNSLFMDFLRLIDELKPSWFVMENVPGILNMKTAAGEHVINIIEDEIAKIGYKVRHRKLLAANYGTPQKRMRVFFIGTNTGKPIVFPEPTHSEKPEKKLYCNTKKWVGVGSVLLPEKKVPKKYFHTQAMIDGFRRRKEKNIKKGNGFGWQILDPDKPSYTISARYWKDGSDALVKYTDKKIRMLTPGECAAIQGFPPDYQFAGNKEEVYTQIGNAVAVLMAKAIALEIKPHIK